MELLQRTFNWPDRFLITALIVLIIVVPILNLFVAEGHPLHIGTYNVTLIGKYLCFALLALSVDLVWGYLGILSLGHGAFFALGGYAMGMYLMRQIGDRGVYGNPDLPDFMVFLDWQELPWFWMGMDSFPDRTDSHRAGAGIIGFSIWLVCLSQSCERCLSVHHYSSDDICLDAGVLSKRVRVWWQQRTD